MTNVPTGLRMFLLFMEYYGLKENAKKGLTNPVIKQWFTDLGYDYDDDTAWCSCMINWLAWKLGIERSHALDARSWLKVGENISLDEAKLGDVVIFWRESITSWKGHVGLYCNHDLYDIYTAGGNQNNQANILPYLIDGPNHGFMACRRLRTLDELKKIA